jgi:hypothetical protein
MKNMLRLGFLALLCIVGVNAYCPGSGGTETVLDGYCIHTYTSNGTFNISSPYLILEYLIVAGGGGGGQYGGGGGAGGLIYGDSYYRPTGTYQVLVGSGGGGASTRNVPGSSGQNSSFISYVAAGGGGGASDMTGGAASSGGSGGGCAYSLAGSGTICGSGGTQGYSGGGGAAAPNYPGGGGGGAGGLGQSAPDGATGGAGGNGKDYDINGSNTYYAGGGGGSAQGGTAGAGGLGGGAAGRVDSEVGYDAVPYTGGGGGGTGPNTPGAGGSGIVIIRYQEATTTTTTAGGTTTTTSSATTTTTAGAHIMSACSSITWSSPTNPVYDRERFCVKGVCKFTDGNITTTELTIEIAPIGTYYVWNNSGQIFYVSNCEDATNGYTVSSSKPTQKSYFHVDPTVSPFVPASATAQTFSAAYSLTYSGLIPKLCEIPAESKNISSLIVFYLNDGTSGFKTRSVYSLTFRERFKVNATYQSGTGLIIYLSRPGTCTYRTSNFDAWTDINTVPASVIVLSNASSANKYNLICNNSFGESASMTYGKGSASRLMIDKTVAMIVALGDGLVMGSLGVSYDEWLAGWWRPEYIILLAACVFILFPAIVAFLIFAVMSKKKPDAHKGKA